MARPVKDINTIAKRFKTLNEIIEASEDALDFGDFVVGASLEEQMKTNEDYKVLEELVQSMREAATLLNTYFKKWYDREEQNFFNKALNDNDMKEMLLKLMVKEGVQMDGFVIKGEASSLDSIDSSNSSSKSSSDEDTSNFSKKEPGVSSDPLTSTSTSSGPSSLSGGSIPSPDAKPNIPTPGSNPLGSNTGVSGFGSQKNDLSSGSMRSSF